MPDVSPGDPSPTPSGQGKREMWETRYRERDPSQFFWYRDDPPPELTKLMESDQRPTLGGVLDLGCGHGVVTSYLAQFLRPAVGVDIAHAAVVQARDAARKSGAPAQFMVVEAPALPFRSESFGLVFDRGCLQAVPRQAWPKYFQEVQRLLRPGGHLWLYCSTVAKSGLMTKRGLRQMLGRMGGGGSSASLSETIRRHIPPSMETVEIEDRRFTTPAGRDRLLVYGLFRKR